MFITPITAGKYSNYTRTGRSDVQKFPNVNFQSADIIQLRCPKKAEETLYSIVGEIVKSLSKGARSLTALQREKLKIIHKYSIDLINPFFEEVTNGASKSQFDYVFARREELIVKDAQDFKLELARFRAADGKRRKIICTHKGGFELYDYDDEDMTTIVRKLESKYDIPDQNYDITVSDLAKKDNDTSEYSVGLFKTSERSYVEFDAMNKDDELCYRLAFREDVTVEGIHVDYEDGTDSFLFEKDGMTLEDAQHGVIDDLD